MLKKTAALLLVLALALSFFAGLSAPVHAAGGVREKLEETLARYPAGSRWTGSFSGARQCFGFAKLVIFRVFGTTSGGSVRAWTYSGSNKAGMTRVGSVTGFSAAKVRSLLSEAKCGDVMQFDQPKNHTLIVWSVSDDGVTVYDCNIDGNCGIRLKKMPFGAWSGRNSARLTLLRADNYKSVDSASVSASAGSRPLISSQPEEAVVPLGAPATFRVKASGDGLSYQWQYSTDSGKTWNNWAGKTAASVSVTVTTHNDGCRYRVTVSNKAGSVTSNAVSLTAIAPPVISAQPKNASAAKGSTASFKVGVQGSGLTYQWQYSKDSGKTWITWSGKTSSSVTVNAKNNSGWLYRVIVRNVAGSVTSSVAKLTVK